eukprot:411521-Amphidinium_carterae.1
MHHLCASGSAGCVFWVAKSAAASFRQDLEALDRCAVVEEVQLVWRLNSFVPHHSHISVIPVRRR